MQVVHRIRLTAAALTLIMIGIVPLLAQAPQEEPPLIAQGELLAVDLDAMTLTIKEANDAERQFRFTDDTEVTGGATGVEGLATLKGASVSVEYKTQDSVDVATKIAIQPQQ